MYIVCPKCQTKFAFNHEMAGINGRKVKCSKCSCIWLQKDDDTIKEDLDDELELDPEIKTPESQYAARLTDNPVDDNDIGSGVNLPALLPARGEVYFYSGQKLLAWVLASMIIFMVINLFPGNVALDYILNDTSLGIYDLHVKHQDKQSGKMIISYKILNSSDKQKKNIPLIRIRLFDKMGKMIMSKLCDYSKTELLPLQTVVMNAEIEVPAGVENIDVTMGNRLDFMIK